MLYNKIELYILIFTDVVKLSAHLIELFCLIFTDVVKLSAHLIELFCTLSLKMTYI